MPNLEIKCIQNRVIHFIFSDYLTYSRIWLVSEKTRILSCTRWQEISRLPFHTIFYHDQSIKDNCFHPLIKHFLGSVIHIRMRELFSYLLVWKHTKFAPPPSPIQWGPRSGAPLCAHLWPCVAYVAMCTSASDDDKWKKKDEKTLLHLVGAAAQSYRAIGCLRFRSLLFPNMLTSEWGRLVLLVCFVKYKVICIWFFV